MRTSAQIVLLAGSLAIVVAGCATPASDSGNAFRMPGAPRTPAAAARPAASPIPGTGSVSPMPGYSNTSHAETHLPQISAGQRTVAQVGYCTAGTGGCTAGSCAGCAKGGASGCNRGSDHACSTRPHGYLVHCPAGWNAYGIDPREFLCDGGDHPPNAMLRQDDTLAGIDPEDTVVHYTTEAGDIEIKASNHVCLYAPRFAAVRKITRAVAGDRAIGLAQFDRPVGANRVEQPLPGLVMTDTTELAHAEVTRRIDAMRERIRGVPVENVLQPLQASDVLAAVVGLTIDEILLLQEDEKALIQRLALAAVTWELDESLEVVIEDLKPPTLTRDERLQGFTIYEFPDAGRLQICKLADRSDALPGEIVNFAIRVQNVGDSAVDHVVLTDNLTTRLQYVEDSQTCSGGAEFEAVINEGQSLRLQWKLTDKLRVGESVTIRFQCKVR